MKKVISLALFGERTRYAQYMSAYVRAHLTLFPQADGWELHVHVDHHNIKDPFLYALDSRGLIRLVPMGETAPLTKAMLWRLAPIWDSSVDYAFCRDVDALPTPRDRACCDRFVASGLDVHTVHDSSSHDGVMGGMSGYRADSFREITGFGSLDALLAMAARTDDEWARHGTDQLVLNALCLGWGAERGGRDNLLRNQGRNLTVFQHHYAGWGGGQARSAPGRWAAPWATVSEPVPDGAIGFTACFGGVGMDLASGKSLTASGVQIGGVTLFHAPPHCGDLFKEADALSSHLGAAGFDIERATEFYERHGDKATMGAVRECDAAWPRHLGENIIWSEISSPAAPAPARRLWVYISSSWRNRVRVRALADTLRAAGHRPYDFTDPTCRQAPEIPPEQFPAQFDPSVRPYREYLTAVPEWRQAVEGNRRALDRCDAVILLLPCGNDAHADAFYGLGRGKPLAVVGQPRAGERTPTHLWADAILDDERDAIDWLAKLAGRAK